MLQVDHIAYILIHLCKSKMQKIFKNAHREVTQVCKDQLLLVRSRH